VIILPIDIFFDTSSIFPLPSFQVLKDTPSPLWVDEGGQWVGPTQTLWLESLKNYNRTVENGALVSDII
jgi:hypothetical protein